MSEFEKKTVPFPTLGVRVSVFRDLVVKVCGGIEKAQGLTTTDICKKFIMPLTATAECSFCELLQREKSFAGMNGLPAVAEANVFISHTWKFKFLDVMEAIEFHFRHDTEGKTVVWFDLFSNNQHAAPNLDFEWWSTTFRNAIFLFNHTVLLLSPWEDPIPLTRAWCLWEIYCTINTDSKFEVAMCASERENFLADIQANICILPAMIARVNVAKSVAYREEDRERIFAAVRAIPGGFDTVNTIVFQTLRKWAIETMRAAILAAPANSNERLQLIGNLAILYRRYGMYDLAEPCARYACECAINSLGKHAPFTLRCQNELVLLLGKRGKHDEAAVCAKICMEARKTHLGPQHVDTLTSMCVYGNILCALKQYIEAEVILTECYEQSRVSPALGESHPDTLKAMFALAHLYFAQAKYDQAEPLYLRHPDSEHCRHFLMIIQASRGEYEASLEYYQQHYDFSRTKQGAAHPETLLYLHNLALIHAAMRNSDVAISMFRECVELRKEVFGPEHPDTLQSSFQLGRVLQRSGDRTASSAVLANTLEIQMRVLGPSHPDTWATRVLADEWALYTSAVIRPSTPVHLCPIFIVAYVCKSLTKTITNLFLPVQLASVEDITFVHDSLDELSIDEFNARQLTRSGGLLAEECPIAAFISEVIKVAPKSEDNNNSKRVNLTRDMSLSSAVASALLPELQTDDDTDGTTNSLLLLDDKLSSALPFLHEQASPATHRLEHLNTTYSSPHKSPRSPNHKSTDRFFPADDKEEEESGDAGGAPWSSLNPLALFGSCGLVSSA